MSRRKRPDSEYLDAARDLSRVVPSLKKYRRKKRLTPAQKAHIARFENALKGATHLVPISKQDAKKLKKEKYAPGVNAVQFRGMGHVTRVRKIKGGNGDLTLIANGRVWLFWKLGRGRVKTVEGMSSAAEDAFDLAFPMEEITRLARAAFGTLKPIAVYLWAPTGAVGIGFRTVEAFLRWLADNWNSGKYTHQERWVNGIGILLRDVGG